MEPFKEFFNKNFVENVADSIIKVNKKFNKTDFVNDVFDSNWINLELKERMRHITICLNKNINLEYEKAIDLLIKISTDIKGLPALVFSDYVEVYGLNYFEISMKALEIFTQLCSAEFAIRPFIINEPKKTMQQMLIWAEIENEHLRRLSSEGCRPRLPWGIAIKEFKKNPKLILPILEKLKNDESEYVRKSVANNLNDISKDNPEIVLEIAKKWYGKSEKTDKIIKHALRTLLKSGNEKALEIIGINHNTNLSITDLAVDKEIVKLNDFIEFKFYLTNKEKENQKVRIEYLFEFPGKANKLNKKIFQLCDLILEFNEKKLINKKHKFQNQSIRTMFTGKHRFTIIVNGKKKDSFEVELM